MAQPQPQLLARVRALASSTPADRAATLRALRNQIVGHVQQKESWVRHGGLEVAVASLGGSPLRGPELLSPPARMPSAGQSAGRLNDDEVVRQLALQLVAAFANGGPLFLNPLSAAGVLPALMAHVSPADNHPALVLASLRALADMARAAVLAPLSCSLHADKFGDKLFSTTLWRRSLESVLSAWSDGSGRDSAEPVNLVALIIRLLCREEQHRAALADNNMLDGLSSLVASFAVARGEAMPNRSDGLEPVVCAVPAPAENGLSYELVLDAVATIVGQSRYRAYKFLWSPAIQAVFPSTGGSFMPSAAAQDAWKALQRNPLFIPRRGRIAMDYLLPAVPTMRPQAQVTAEGLVIGPGGHLYHPMNEFGDPIGGTGAGGAGGAGDADSPPAPWPSDEPSVLDTECPVLLWLMLQLRTRRCDLERIAAAHLIGCLFSAGGPWKQLHQSRLAGMLVVPVLLDMLRRNPDGFAVVAGPPPTESLSASSAELRRTWTVLERVPAILAALAVDDELIQKAAYDCGAVKAVSTVLKASYCCSGPDVPTSSCRVWTTTGHSAEILLELPGSCSLGEKGRSPTQLRLGRVREGALRAVGALCAGSDDYRKAFVAEEIVPYIIVSLSEHPARPSPSPEVGDFNEKPGQRPVPRPGHGPGPRQGQGLGLGQGQGSAPKGRPNENLLETIQRLVRNELDEPNPSHSGCEDNPVSVIVAACHAIRIISRSVSILQTSLVDSKVATPIFRHMQHPDLSVQIAASAAMCNLVALISPMRSALCRLGVLKIMFDNTRSTVPALQVNALWALKHFVYDMNMGVKKACLKELGPTYLMRLISGEPLRHHDKGDGDHGGDHGADHGGRNPGDDDTTMTGQGEYLDSEFDNLHDKAGAGSGPYRGFGKSEHPSRGPAFTCAAGMPAGVGLFSAAARLSNLRDLESDPSRRTRNDALATQEQALCLARNLITPSESDPNPTAPTTAEATCEMVDLLLQGLGEDRLFSELAAKLGPGSRYNWQNGGDAGGPFRPPTSTSGPGSDSQARPPQPGVPSAAPYLLPPLLPPRIMFTEDLLKMDISDPNGPLSRRISPPPRIVHAVLFLLVNIAGGASRHKDTVVCQTSLLELVLHEASSCADRDVRAGLCHLVINLISDNDPSDESGRVKRARDLIGLGFADQITRLREDRELNVKERAGHALYMLRKASGLP